MFERKEKLFSVEVVQKTPFEPYTNGIRITPEWLNTNILVLCHFVGLRLLIRFIIYIPYAIDSDDKNH